MQDMKLNTCKRQRTKFQQYNENGELLCYHCKKYKPIEEFDINPVRWFRDNRDYRCKSCKKEQYLKRKAISRGKQNLDRMLLERWHGAKDRAIKQNLEFNITVDYLKYLWNNQNGKCALSNLDMTYIFNSGRIPTNVSIDKINPSKGYIMGNIQLVCMACNQIKSDLSEKEMYNFCKSIVEVYENKNNKGSQGI